ncbi:hypothetical protein KRR23_14255 [Pseudomonas sp. CVAP|uniref:hypothetical protein n=1 Tax=Pseudomonas sp. CVAP\|nr:hypothetical protein [Pseudomonas sp. CVAP\
MTVENLKTRKSVPSLESGQGQVGSVDLLIFNSTILPDETPGSAIREDHLSEESRINPASPPGKIELHSKPAPPTPPTIVWRKLMLEQ